MSVTARRTESGSWEVDLHVVLPTANDTGTVVGSWCRPNQPPFGGDEPAN